MKDEDVARLVGTWVHSHEEDDEETRVFRRPGAKLPPTRGRARLEIGSDLSARRLVPGADDRPTPGGDYRVVLGDRAGTDEGDRDLVVKSVTADRLLVARKAVNNGP